ncbi:hypothetical protein [Celeribacter sp. PS-C1]|uniref:hypothetical protein n=1 Tax=Celeribacter sp. PS-C1 TaxID=2820813 RepID=UPI001CA55B4F|nr:hypothetical protein [Celeribacter sp. PS-C1]MBW6419633.1 hypothetical protein [Celeribacter sp. PS-C1]
MREFRENDKSHAICMRCEKHVATTFTYRDVPLDDEAGTVEHILVGVCDECGAAVSVPVQSKTFIKEFLQGIEAERRDLEQNGPSLARFRKFSRGRENERDG